MTGCMSSAMAGEIDPKVVPIAATSSMRKTAEREGEGEDEPWLFPLVFMLLAIVFKTVSYLSSIMLVSSG